MTSLKHDYGSAGAGARTIDSAVRAIALVGFAFAAVSVLAGCGPKPDPTTSAAAAANSSSSGPQVVAPPAKPGAVIGAGNPPAGQPGHMSPAMQAQLQHYQSFAPKK